MAVRVAAAQVAIAAPCHPVDRFDERMLHASVSRSTHVRRSPNRWRSELGSQRWRRSHQAAA
jgi:hypothetical protein